MKHKQVRETNVVIMLESTFECFSFMLRALQMFQSACAFCIPNYGSIDFKFLR